MRAPAALLSRHRAGDPVCFGRAGVKCASDLRRDAGCLAAALGAAREDERVVVLCRDRYHFAAALLAAWSQGFIVVLPPSSQAEVVRKVRQGPHVLSVLHDGEGDRGIDVREHLFPGGAQRSPGRAQCAADPQHPPLAPRFAPEQPLAMLFTSGSTGAPVACPKTAGQLLGETALLASTFSIAPGERFVVTVPPHHLYGLLFGVLLPLAAGAAFSRHSPLHAPSVAEALRGAHGLVSVPAHLRGLALSGGAAEVRAASADDASAGVEFPPLRRVFSSGAPLSSTLSKRLGSRTGWRVTEVFGSTETGGIATRTGGAGPWMPLPGLRVDADASGHMLLGSPFLPPGAPQPFPCADRVEVVAGGAFRHLGREDGVLKVGGVRVSLAEVEAHLLRIEGVHDAAAFAIDAPEPRGKEIWAVVASERALAEVRAALRGWLTPVAMPRRLRAVVALPRTATGKLPRGRLLALFDRDASGVPPSEEKGP